MASNKLIFIVALCFSTLTYAQSGNDEPRRVKAPLQEATVFFQGAELKHKANLSVSKGSNEVWITDVSPQVDASTIKISTTKGVVITSYEYSLDYINKKKTSTIEKSLEDSVKLYKKKIGDYDINMKTNLDLLELLKANKSIAGSQTGLSVAELMKMVDYYSAKSNELNKAQGNLAEKKIEAQTDLIRIENQLRQESVKNVKAIGIIKLNFNSPVTSTSDFSISYFTQHAAWVPYYNINAKGIGEQTEIATKAKVAQTTGMDWDNVKLTLSSATPSNNKIAPLFDIWFVDFAHSAFAGKFMESKHMSASQMNYSHSDSNMKIRGLSKESVEESPSASPLYIVNGESYTESGFQELDLRPDMIADMHVLKGSEATNIYGARASGGVVIVTTKTMSDFVTRSDSELNMEYAIAIPYTVTGNGKAQNIDLKTEYVTPTFQHFAAPKLDTETFILAEIADWQKLGLLSGKANITFDGTYIGETQIDASSMMKKLSLTMGTDPRIAVKREKVQDFSSKKFLGKDIKQEFMYRITVKNNHNRKINMLLKEQYPQSNQKEIEIEIHKDTTPATHIDQTIGVWHWNFDLEPGERKEFVVKYSVKYPKDRAINL